uniref:Tetratricopeptide repeat protein n=1 Tax=candidate division WOR-3 bacterium TaxID=2052148 RepID=A0A7V0Z637_UNCW3
MKKAIGNRYFSSTKQMAIQAMKGHAYVLMILGEYDRALYDLDCASDLVDKLFTTKIWTRKLFDRISLREIERADILMLKSWIYKTKGNMNKAMMQLQQMIRNQSEKINPKYKGEILNRINRTRVGIFNTMGAIYGDRGIYIKAISCFKKHFAISKKIRDVGGMGTA